ncbi:phosphotransferase family protein [Vibrio diazotrophicus]|uniref:phosphotransferase family protein n=1 Tax=Vibrio diazotrophicus TaxID=685 RepID=UPI00142D4A95|nr:choline kinase [Vibrio diazotrophicus]NIY92113.1 choline kinase [Vibrio diazotrophicus]
MLAKDLSKMGNARVSVEVLDGINCVLKQDASEVEIHFYQTAAQNLKGVNSPALVKLDGNNLFIEHIPNRISLQELRAQPDLFVQLASLHRSEYFPSFPVKKHEWTDDATDEALRILNLPNSAESSIKRVQSLSSCIFECKTLISGDTNDGNWGTRDNGELVLFDWERFGHGSPAIDLAPLVTGLGTISDYKLIIGEYTRHNALLPDAELLRHLIIAKCWIIIEVVNILVSRNNPEQKKYLDWYKTTIPRWLASVKESL